MKTNFRNIFLTTLLVTAFPVTSMAANTVNPEHSYADANVNGVLTVSVSINNITSQDGYIMAALFNSKSTFLGDAPVRAERVAVTGNSVSFTYNNLPVGEYAIAVYHDEDGDAELDTGMFGIPSEPYGFSNNAPVRFGPPKWDASKFTLNGSNAAQSIRLK